MRATFYTAGLLASLSGLLLAPVSAQPVPTAPLTFNLEPQDLADALLAVAKTSGREILFDSAMVSGKRAPRLTGEYPLLDALRRLLRGSGLAVREADGALVIVRDGDASADGEVVVTGSRIRSAQRYSQVTTLDRRALRAQGQTDLGQAIRATLPQNFGGGQSPVIGIGAEDFGSDNITSGSAINLRGLGPNATLTLLNGRRFAYDGVAEGVDVAAVPLAAIERIEVVADGASAVYGSDAVAGVANVILRRDFSGFETAARLGTSPAGGNTQRQLEAVTGGTWSTGGVIVTASYNRNSAINAGDRAFSRSIDSSTTLLPRLRQFGAVVSGHQSLGPAVEFDLDLLYSRRTSLSAFSATTTASFRDNGVSRDLLSRSFVASPSLKIALGPAWAATINGNYSRDTIGYRTQFYSGGVATPYRGRYRNSSIGGEFSIEGPLFATDGGVVRLATGGGYRRVGLAGANGIEAAPPTTIVRGHRESYYAFGEVNAPLVGAANRSPGVERLAVNLAGRFEHYPQIGDVFTPKLGVLYAPVKALELRATWGRSFKAPTLYQLFQAPGAYALPAAAFGGTNYPATANAIFLYGGNPALEPQRARTWSAGAVLTPSGDGRVKVEASYFNIRYGGRIVVPISSSSRALSDPRIAELVTINPSAAAVTALVASLGTPLQYFGNGPYDPGNFAAIIDDRNRNVAIERYEGVDGAASWRLPIGAADLTLSAGATYLVSHRRLSRNQAELPLAGHIFQPPHFRGRGGGTFVAGGLTASAFLTVAGGVTDDRYQPVENVSGQRTVDLSLGYSFDTAAGPLRGLSVQLSVLNAFNDLPARIRNQFGYLTPFDSANYDPAGRFVSVRIAKQW